MSPERASGTSDDSPSLSTELQAEVKAELTSDLDDTIERALSEVGTPAVRSTLPDEASFRCVVNYRGAYAYWDLSNGELDRSRDPELVEDHTEQNEDLPIIDRENNPLVAEVWS